MTTKALSTSKPAWWKEQVIYQIYPSSFKDNNGDGWGDLKGILSKLDYLKDLGVDIIWISPIYKSPQADMGYDISDYKTIDPIYGSNEDVDELIAELKKRDMKLMMDLVVNHTSNEHEWFLESRKSKDNPKRDWYIWRPSKGTDADGKPIPPNNWCQLLGDANSAWTYAEETGEFYLSLFTPQQPDLNWENPAVVDAVHDVMNFWLDKGVCGYRMDVINLISKVPGLPDAEPNKPPGHKYHDGAKYFINGPRFHEFMHDIHDKVLKPHDAITVGEMPGISDSEEVVKTVGANSGELNMMFIFDIVNIDRSEDTTDQSLRKFNAADIASIQSKWQSEMIRLDGWNSVFVSNHDQPRPVSRYVDDSDEFRARGAKLLALMETTLCGTLFVYQGEELGLRNLPADWDVDAEYRDVDSLNLWAKAKALSGGDAAKLAEWRAILQARARDHARYPMPWEADEASSYGFSAAGVKPWMRPNTDSAAVCAAAQSGGAAAPPADDRSGGVSVWGFWQRALKLRKENVDVVAYGSFEQVGKDQVPEQVFAYVRQSAEGKKWLVVLNFSGKEAKWKVPAGCEVETWLQGTYGPGEIDKEKEGELVLRPWEGLVGNCKQS